MADELQESEVIFNRENVEDEDYCTSYQDRSSISKSKESSTINKAKRLIKMKANSVPVAIPDNVDSELDCGEDGEIVPPHVIVRRRVDGKMMAFSVCSGNGRTLKGRDLSEVRNSVLRMTGFLET